MYNAANGESLASSLDDRKYHGLLTFTKSRDANCGIDRVWDVISDVDKEPKYYDGLGSVKNLSRDGNIIEREVVVGFLKHAGRQTVVLTAKKEVEVRMTKGPTTGTRTTTLMPLDGSRTRIVVRWEVELHVPAFVRGMVTHEIAKGTEKALERIVRDSEGETAAEAGTK